MSTAGKESYRYTRDTSETLGETAGERSYRYTRDKSETLGERETEKEETRENLDTIVECL